MTVSKLKMCPGQVSWPTYNYLKGSVQDIPIPVMYKCTYKVYRLHLLRYITLYMYKWMGRHGKRTYKLNNSTMYWDTYTVHAHVVLGWG